MAATATLIRDYLLQDATITALTATRIYDRDVRTAGPDTPSTFPYADSGVPLTHLIVDDSGGTAAPLGPSGAYQDQVRVWIIGPNTATGRGEVELLTQRVRVRLHRWQEGTSRVFATYASRTGFVADPPPHLGVMDVLTFAVAGLTVGARS